MGNIEKASQAGNKEQSITWSKDFTPERRDQVGTALDVRWLGLNTRLIDVALHALIQLDDQALDYVLSHGFRPSHLNPLPNLGQPLRQNEAFPSMIQLRIPDQTIPEQLDASGDIHMSLGSLCFQVATHIDSWRIKRDNNASASDTKAFGNVGAGLRTLAEVTSKVPVLLRVKKSVSDVTVTGLSLSDYETFDLDESGK